MGRDGDAGGYVAYVSHILAQIHIFKYRIPPLVADLADFIFMPGVRPAC